MHPPDRVRAAAPGRTEGGDQITEQEIEAQSTPEEEPCPLKRRPSRPEAIDRLVGWQLDIRAAADRAGGAS